MSPPPHPAHVGRAPHPTTPHVALRLSVRYGTTRYRQLLLGDLNTNGGEDEGEGGASLFERISAAVKAAEEDAGPKDPRRGSDMRLWTPANGGPRRVQTPLTVHLQRLNAISKMVASVGEELGVTKRRLHGLETVRERPRPPPDSL